MPTHDSLAVVDPELFRAFGRVLACTRGKHQNTRANRTLTRRNSLRRCTAPAGNMEGTKRSMFPKLFFGTLPCR